MPTLKRLNQIRALFHLAPLSEGKGGIRDKQRGGSRVPPDFSSSSDGYFDMEEALERTLEQDHIEAEECWGKRKRW